MKNIYLDDQRTPHNHHMDWVVVRNYDEFIATVQAIGLENIGLMSLDHDLGPSAISEWYRNVLKNYRIDYENITEKTGLDVVKWIVEKWSSGSPVCKVMIHSSNCVGSANMMGIINNFKHLNRLPQDCKRWVVPFEHEDYPKVVPPQILAEQLLRKLTMYKDYPIDYLTGQIVKTPTLNSNTEVILMLESFIDLLGEYSKDDLKKVVEHIKTLDI